MGGTPVIQTSFNAGEWAPALNARVDLTKYHAGAALLQNFFVDYRGGATIRAGTKYILQTRLTSTTRLIPFQASQFVTYVLEFGQGYIRFFNNGAPVLEAGKTVSGATQASPGVITATGHGYSNDDWVFFSSVAGMTQLNGNYYIVAGVTTNTFTLTDLNGVAINTSTYGAYTSGGVVQRLYTLLTSPYQAGDLAAIKYVQNVNVMVLTHPNYPPQQLVLNSATSWTLGAISFGATVAAPTGLSTGSTLAAGTVFYAYVVTAVDINGQESGPSSFATVGSAADIRTTAGTNTVAWSAVAGAKSYNVYRANPSYGGAVPAGSDFGFVGNVTGTSFYDSNIAPDFAQGPPVLLNPFSGAGVASVTVTTAGTFTSVPTVTFTGGGGTGTTAIAALECYFATPGGTPGTGYAVGDLVTILYDPSGAVFQVTSVLFGGGVNSLVVINPGSLSTGSPITAGTLTHGSLGGSNATINTNWRLKNISVTSPGAGYATPPTVGGLAGGGGAATAALGAAGNGNPTVPGIFQQRLVLAGPVNSPQTIDMSQTGSYYNFNVNSPIEADNAISGTLSTGSLNTIQSMVSQPYGLIVLSDKGAWLINGGSAGSAVSPIQFVANPQVFSGAASQPAPVIAGDNILYVQAKNSIVRSMAFDFYKQIYTGADVSVLSSHLFYGFSVGEWAWAEEPFKVLWAVRNDGALLSLTYLKEQELTAWAHSSTQGSFKSVATVTEKVPLGVVDAVYFVVQRIINGLTVQYVERMTELYYPSGLANAWVVDAGLNYSGPPVLTVSGAQHLANMSVVGLLTDSNGNTTELGFTMPVSGTFTLPLPPFVPATAVTYDPATAHSVNLSNGNLTATNTSNVADQGVEVATANGRTSGKYYFEMTLVNDMDHGSSFGVATTSATYANLTANGTGGVACYISTAVSGDPNWTNVALLAGFEGSNGSTGAPGMNDESSHTHGTATAVNSAHISTAQKKAGNSSLLTATATSDWITWPDSTDWHLGTSHFTVECFFYLNSHSNGIGSTAYAFLVSQWQSGSPWCWALMTNTTGNLGWVVTEDGGTLDFDLAGPVPSLSTWHHAAIDYDGVKYRLYLDGTTVATSTTARNIYAPLTAVPLSVGASNASQFFVDGYMDEVRITTGVARYATDTGFTVPTVPFPRGGGSGGGQVPKDIFANGSDSGDTIGIIAPSDVIGVAVDLDNRQAWFKPVAGSEVGTGWNGSGTANPATNTGGVSVLAGTIVPYVSYAAANPPVITTWNPSDKSAAITLSNGNLTATASSAGDMAVRGTVSYSAGKHYFELTIGSTYAGGDTGLGIATATAALGSVGSSVLNALLVYPAGITYYNGVSTGINTTGALSTGMVIGVAIDLVNFRAWFANLTTSGFWNGNATYNPATNVGGIDISSVFGSNPAFPTQSFGPSASGSFITANFGATAFTGSVPSGFTMWNSAGGGGGSPGNVWTANFGASAFAGTVPTGFNAGWPGASAPASGYIIVTVGLAYTAQLQTLPLDIGEPTVQGKRKKITGVTVRVKDALGLTIGGDAASQVPMKDLVQGNVGSATNVAVTGLVTADARTIIDPRWTVPGQYLIQQINPYPASVLGVIPEITVGDTNSK